VIRSVPISIVVMAGPHTLRCGGGEARAYEGDHLLGGEAVGAKHMLSAAFFTAPGQQLERTAPVGLRKAVATACGDHRDYRPKIATNAFSKSRGRSASLQDQQPLALLLREAESPHGLGFGRLLAWRCHDPQAMGASAHDGDPPVTELGGLFLW
jgi:hypothetical protein